MSLSEELSSKIARRTAGVGVIGLGYVGLPLAVAFARVGYRTVGIDLNADRVGRLQRGESYIGDVSGEVVSDLIKKGHLVVTTDYSALGDLEAIFICVPTPYTPAKAPDISYIVNAAEGIAHYLRPGQLVILESTTYPGTTNEVVLPILEKTGLKVGQDFFLAFSPERVDPGPAHPQFDFHNTPKVVGGVTPVCTQLAAQLLGQFVATVHPVSSPRAAEMTKLLENIFRNVNIALVNELALLCERMGIDIWEVIDAARTKPFGFMPFTPGPGVGGHCIPVDPYYLSWKAREYDFYTKFIEFAAEVNQSMPYHVVETVARALSDRGRPLRGAHVAVLGVAFKKDIEDARNSPAERIIELLVERGAVVCYNDPHVPRFIVGYDRPQEQRRYLTSTPLDDHLFALADALVIVTGHSAYDYADLVQRARLVVDTVNATRNVTAQREKIVRIGAPL